MYLLLQVSLSVYIISMRQGSYNCLKYGSILSTVIAILRWNAFWDKVKNIYLQWPHQCLFPANSHNSHKSTFETFKGDSSLPFSQSQFALVSFSWLFCQQKEIHIPPAFHCDWQLTFSTGYPNVSCLELCKFIKVFVSAGWPRLHSVSWNHLTKM